MAAKVLTFGQTKITVNGEFDRSQLSDIIKNGLSDSIFAENEKISFPVDLKLMAIEFESGNLKSAKPYPGFITTENKPISLSTFNARCSTVAQALENEPQDYVMPQFGGKALDAIIASLAGKSFTIKKMKAYIQEFVDNKPATITNSITGKVYRKLKAKNFITLA